MVILLLTQWFCHTVAAVSNLYDTDAYNVGNDEDEGEGEDQKPTKNIYLNS